MFETLGPDAVAEYGVDEIFADEVADEAGLDLEAFDELWLLFEVYAV